MSSTPWSASHTDSSSEYDITPAKPSRASVRSTMLRTRTDLLATRIGTPPARRTRSSALAQSAGSSTIASGAPRSAVAESRRSNGSGTRSDYADAWGGPRTMAWLPQQHAGVASVVSSCLVI